MIGVLIAAGRGRRMGGTKQLTPWPPGAADTTLIAAAFDAIAPACDEILVVLDHETDAVVAALGERLFKIVTGNADGDMFDSVRAGLAAATSQGHDHALLQLGDHPQVAPTTLDTLRVASAEHPGLVIIPEHEGRGGHPIIIPRTIADTLHAYTGTDGLRGFLHEHPERCRRIEVPDPGVVRDIDRPDDLRGHGRAGRMPLMSTARTDPGLLAVARGAAPADLLLTGGRFVNVFTRRIERGDVALFGGRIASVGPSVDAAVTVDLDGACVCPGFIDAHMHLESTMMLPAEFARVALPHGTTGVMLDPHEIANVAGIAGIRLMMELTAQIPMRVWFGAPSCVPASPLETSGAELTAADLRPLFDDDRVIALAEMMNFPGVVHADPAVLEKVRLGLELGLVDGHAPGLDGARLQAYVAAGVGSDHECTTADEARTKLALGMRVFIREGSAARNLEALLPAVDETNAHRFCFCTDDRHPHDLIEHGHIDHVVRRAIALGLSPATAIAMGTLHAAEHYGLTDVGAVAPGRLADLVVLDDPGDPQPRLVYVNGQRVAEDGRCTVTIETDDHGRAAIDAIRGTVRLPDLDETSLARPARAATVRVIGLRPHQLITDELRLPAHVSNGVYASDLEQDVLKLAVIERHRSSGRIGIGFVRGFGLREGALASTVGHDAHNLTVVGTNDRDMITAARALADAGGGQCAVGDGAVIAILPLPFGGLLSDEPAETIVAQQRAVLDAAAALGCALDDPFMPLSFLPLTVIPKLKLSDLGLVDVERFEIVPLEAE